MGLASPLALARVFFSFAHGGLVHLGKHLFQLFGNVEQVFGKEVHEGAPPAQGLEGRAYRSTEHDGQTDLLKTLDGSGAILRRLADECGDGSKRTLDEIGASCCVAHFQDAIVVFLLDKLELVHLPQLVAAEFLPGHFHLRKPQQRERADGRRIWRSARRRHPSWWKLRCSWCTAARGLPGNLLARRPACQASVFIEYRCQAPVFIRSAPSTRNPHFVETRADLRVDGATRTPFSARCGQKAGVAGGIAGCLIEPNWENSAGGLPGSWKSTRNPALVRRKPGKGRSGGPTHPQPAPRSCRWPDRGRQPARPARRCSSLYAARPAGARGRERFCSHNSC